MATKNPPKQLMTKRLNEHALNEKKLKSSSVRLNSVCFSKKKNNLEVQKPIEQAAWIDIFIFVRKNFIQKEVLWWREMIESHNICEASGLSHWTLLDTAAFNNSVELAKMNRIKWKTTLFCISNPTSASDYVAREPL